jgi:hypothetical protein
MPNKQSLNINDAIRLNQYHFLPNEKAPELVMFIDSVQQQWFVERLGVKHVEAIALNEGDIIEFAGQSWQLKLSHIAQATEQSVTIRHKLNQLSFTFDLSLDEEHTRLRVETPDENIEFFELSHHYLTLNLARYRAADISAGLDSQHQGWVYPEQLLKGLGVDISHLNIQIHRARKQFSDTVNVLDSQCFLERYAGKLRFGGSQFKIKKGQRIECESRAVTSPAG